MPFAKAGTNRTTISLLTVLLGLVLAVCPASAFLRWQPTPSVASPLQEQHRSPFLPPSSMTTTPFASSVPAQRAHQNDDNETEEERLRLDAEARERMAEHVARVQAAQAQSGGADGEQVDRAPWKWSVRQRVWDMMEAKDIAEPPRPVHHRIPNFKGARDAAERLVALPEFVSANCIKCNPDTPQNQVRFLTMEAGKLLLVPQPRLRTGFFSLLDPGLIHTTERLFAATSAGVKKHGAPLSLSSTLPRVDLIVVGSVAVDPVTGARIGKGEGFAELEYGMLRLLGVIDKDTPVVTTVRDEQVNNDLVPADAKVLRHDVPVDIIVTPTRVIRTEAQTHIDKPTGIYWDLLSPEKLGAIKVLQELKARIEKETGQTLPTGPSEVLPPLASRGGKTGGREGRREKEQWHLVVRNLPYAACQEEGEGAAGVRDLLVGDEKELEVEKVHFLKTSDGRLPNGTAFVMLKSATAALAGPDAATVARLAISLDGKELGGRRVGVAVWERRERPRGARQTDGRVRTRGDGERSEAGREGEGHGSPSALGTESAPLTS